MVTIVGDNELLVFFCMSIDWRGFLVDIVLALISEDGMDKDMKKFPNFRKEMVFIINGVVHYFDGFYLFIKDKNEWFKCFAWNASTQSYHTNLDNLDEAKAFARKLLKKYGDAKKSLGFKTGYVNFMRYYAKNLDSMRFYYV